MRETGKSHFCWGGYCVTRVTTGGLIVKTLVLSGNRLVTYSLEITHAFHSSDPVSKYILLEMSPNHRDCSIIFRVEFLSTHNR